MGGKEMQERELKGQQETFGVMNMFIILIVGMALEKYPCVKIY